MSAPACAPAAVGYANAVYWILLAISGSVDRNNMKQGLEELARDGEQIALDAGLLLDLFNAHEAAAKEVDAGTAATRRLSDQCNLLIHHLRRHMHRAEQAAFNAWVAEVRACGDADAVYAMFERSTACAQIRDEWVGARDEITATIAVVTGPQP